MGNKLTFQKNISKGATGTNLCYQKKGANLRKLIHRQQPIMNDLEIYLKGQEIIKQDIPVYSILSRCTTLLNRRTILRTTEVLGHRIIPKIRKMTLTLNYGASYVSP